VLSNGKLEKFKQLVKTGFLRLFSMRRRVFLLAICLYRSGL
jgi:hypothetical protein